MSIPPFPEECVEEPSLAGLRQVVFATECVLSPEPFPSLEFAPPASATDEEAAGKESQLALKSSDSAQFETGSKSHGVASQRSNWSQEEGSGANSELVTAGLFTAKQEITSSAENAVGTHGDPLTPELSSSQASVELNGGNCTDYCQLSDSETESGPSSPWLEEPVEMSSSDNGGKSGLLVPPLPRVLQDCPPADTNSFRQCNTGEEQPEVTPKALRTFLWLDEPWSEEEEVDECSEEPAVLVDTCGPSDFDASLELCTHLEKKSPEPECACGYSQFGCTFMGNSVELTSHERDSSSHHLKLLSDEVQRMGHAVDVDQYFLSGSLLDLESEISNLREGFSELALMVQTLQATSYNGEFIWKIPNIARRMEEARIGKTISLYSAPFYTSRFGYKMCLRLYLNGDSSGKGTHLSFFFTIMKGEYDALWSWPFQQMATLVLPDQDKRKNIVQAFRPHPSSSNFWKPKTEMNIASGCPKFSPLSVLVNPWAKFAPFSILINPWTNPFDGFRKEEFLSFFLAIMRGEYDALLSWPFREMVTIMMLPNQEKRK